MPPLGLVSQSPPDLRFAISDRDGDEFGKRDPAGAVGVVASDDAGQFRGQRPKRLLDVTQRAVDPVERFNLPVGEVRRQASVDRGCLARHECPHRRLGRDLVPANQCDRGLDFRADRHVSQRLDRTGQVFPHREQQRVAPFHRRVDVALAVLDLGRRQRLPVDPVCDWRFAIVRQRLATPNDW